MSFVKNIQNQAIDDLIQSLASKQELRWVPCSCAEFTKIKPSHIDNVYYATEYQIARCSIYNKIILVLIGSSKECTPTRVSEFARIYSLSTQNYNNVDRFRRYSVWLSYRNNLIIGFTKHEDNYYMVAYRKFYRYYSRYGFCSACGILRCSPVWCICGHKELSDGWTSKNKQLDKFIKKSQMETKSPNEAYLEWIPPNCIQGTFFGSSPLYKERETFGELGYGLGSLYLPRSGTVHLIPLEITDKTDEVNYLTLCHIYLTVS